MLALCLGPEKNGATAPEGLEMSQACMRISDGIKELERMQDVCVIPRCAGMQVSVRLPAAEEGGRGGIVGGVPCPAHLLRNHRGCEAIRQGHPDTIY